MCAPGAKQCAPDGQSYGACVGDVVPSAETCTLNAAPPLASDEDCDGAANDHCATWSARFGGAGDQLAYAVATDGDGNIYITGSFANSINIAGSELVSAGGLDIFVAKLSPTGDLLWASRFGDASDQQAFGIAVDGAANVLLTGSFVGSVSFGGATHTSQANADLFVAKLSTSGAFVWSKSYGDASDQIGRAVAATKFGVIYVTGEAAGSLSFGLGFGLNAASGKDIFVAKLAANGSTLWAQMFGGAGDDAGLAVADGIGDAVILGGSFATSVSFGGPMFISAGGSDGFIAKLEADGGYAFSRAVASDEDDATLAVGEDAGGDALATGTFGGAINLGGADLVSAGESDVFVAKYTSTGDHVWSERLGGPAEQKARGLALHISGAALVAGAMSGAVDFGDLPRTTLGPSDAFIAALDGASGGHLWSRSFGDASAQGARAIASDPQGGVVVVGDFTGAIDLGSGPMTSQGGRDVFVAKIK